MLVGSLVIQGIKPEGVEELPPQLRFWTFLIGTVFFQGAAFVIVHVMVRRCGTTWADAFGWRRKGLGRGILMACVVVILVLPIAWYVSQLSAQWMESVDMEVVPQGPVETLREANSAWEKFYFGFVAILLAPVVEELLFRGMMYPALKQVGFPRFALLFTSFFFALIHLNLMTFLPLFLFAMVLVWLYEQTDNLIVPIVAHSLFNAVNFVFLLNQQWVEQWMKRFVDWL